MISVASCAKITCSGDALPGSLVGQIEANLFGEFLERGEEDGFFVLLEALQMSRRAFGQEKSSAAGDLEALVNELVLIGVGEKAQVDARSPDGVRDSRRGRAPRLERWL